MHRVLIVDDEKFIRKSIRNRIAWGKYNMQVVAEAANGEEALQTALVYRPDICFVDIRMPVMDGLAFISRQQQSRPGTLFVVLSAYSDFTYAQQALRLGIEDYVLKPVEEKQVEDILYRLQKKLEQRTQDAEYSTLGYGGLECPPYRFGGFTACALATGGGIGPQDKALLQNITAESLRRQGEGDVYCVQDAAPPGVLVFLLNHEADAIVDWDVALAGVMDAHDVSHAAVYAAEEQPLAAVDGCIYCLKHKIYQTGAQVITKAHTQFYTDRSAELEKTFLAIYDWVVKGNTGLARELLLKIIENGVNANYSMQTLEMAVRETVMIVKKACVTKGPGQETALLLHRLERPNALLLYGSLGTLRMDLATLVEVTLHSPQDADANRIEKIKAYVQTNLSADLNVADIAAQFHLNGSYLSTLFHEKTGDTLGGYIERMRMERACVLLDSSTISVRECAFAVGYADPNYFTKVFKKHTGFTPARYKKADKSEDVL